MLKKTIAFLLACIVASTLAVSVSAQRGTEDISYWPKKGPSNGLIIIGVLVLAIIVGAVYWMRRRNDASK